MILSSTLAACGGGGSSGASTSAQSTSSTPPVSSSSPSPTPTPAAPATPAAANNAPTIVGAAQASITAGQAYSFTPTAADADKDPITFTIANKPAWASFNSATGALTGTPAAKDVGTYPDVEIAATDGTAVTALPAFTIAVVAAASSNLVSVSWTPPTQNADGSALTDLSGYKIHYGTQSGSYTDSIAVENAGLTRYDIDSLPKGKIYIAMTALNASGAESDYSAETTVTVN